MTPLKFDNPLNQLFDLDPSGADEVPAEDLVQATAGELAALAAPGDPTPVPKDEEDVAIDAKVDEVYDEAMGTFRQQMSYTEVIEPRYAARNAEVAATFLSIALQAAATRAKTKTDRRRTSTFIPYANNTTTNIVASREDVLRALRGEPPEAK